MLRPTSRETTLPLFFASVLTTLRVLDGKVHQCSEVNVVVVSSCFAEDVFFTFHI